MNPLKTLSRMLYLAVCATLAGVLSASAQTVTTGSIAGTVTDPQGGVLPSAIVVAVHVPTGTSYETVAKADGRFVILDVRVGGPYTVTVKMAGFKDAEHRDLTVTLGQQLELSFKLEVQAVSETVTVTGAPPPIDTTVAGAGGNISPEVKDALPTINRSIVDVVRTNPLFNSIDGGSGSGGNNVISVAGTSFRYNSVQIDGAANNDLFGLASSGGLPGGATGSQPISFDAIQEIQLVVSPYDVRQGGFSGGGINAITKSGSNVLHGSGFYYGRNQNWVGKYKTTSNPSGKLSTFSDKQGGFTIGGPIVQNKAFFFAALDNQRKLTPTGWSVGGTGTDLGQRRLWWPSSWTFSRTSTSYNPGPESDGRVQPREQQQQGVRAHGLQPRAGRTAHGPPQLRERAVRRRLRRRQTSFITPDHYYRTVSTHELDRGAVELDVRRWRQRAAGGLHAGNRLARRPAVRAAAVPAGHGGAVGQHRRLSPAASSSRPPTSCNRTSSS